MKRILEIDTDGLVFRLCYFGEPDPAQATAIAVDRLITKLRADDARCYISGRINDGYRRKVVPTYKEHRKTGKPLPYAEALRRAYDDIRAGHWMTPVEEPGLEADDLVGIAATTDDGHEHVIVSFDKDLMSIPGEHYNPKGSVKSVVSLDEANRRFWGQVLSGDATDGYKGCKGVGKIGAEKLLAAGDYARVVRAAYEARGHTPEYLLSQCICARILRAGDYDINTKTFNYNYLYEHTNDIR